MECYFKNKYCGGGESGELLSVAGPESIKKYRFK